MEEAYKEFWWEILRERDHRRDSGIDGRIILRQIFRKYIRMCSVCFQSIHQQFVGSE
jgi:hypothetical protein